MSNSGSENEAVEDFEQGDVESGGDNGNDLDGAVGDDEGGDEDDDEEKAERIDSRVPQDSNSTPAVNDQIGTADIDDVGFEAEAAVQDTESRSGDVDDEDAVRVVGRRRKAMAEVHDPSRVRRRKLREYYAGGGRILLHLKNANIYHHHL